MKALIVVHSQTGHTAFFARAIAEELRNNKCEADIELLRPTKSVRPSTRSVELRRIPDSNGYDIVLVGCPVWAFKESAVARAYLTEIKSLQGIRAAAFVTHGLPLSLLGARQAVHRLSHMLDTLGATVQPGESLLWMLRQNQKKMRETAQRLVKKVL